MNNKQQIIHIHGGETWGNYDEYIHYLKTRTCDPYASLKRERWHYNYYSFLDKNNYDIIKPDMPCKPNAHYNEWSIWFERHIEFLDNNIILVGHSLGGGFLMKWLSENKLEKNIQQLHLVAPIFHYEADDYKLVSFKNTSFPGIFFENNIDEVHIYHSKDDPYVPISESEEYAEKIPGAHFHIFEDRGHFLGEDFPELFENIIKSA